jgi:hypothetical protein
MKRKKQIKIKDKFLDEKNKFILSEKENFQCPNCKTSKAWYETPICETCDYDENEKEFNKKN